MRSRGRRRNDRGRHEAETPCFLLSSGTRSVHPGRDGAAYSRGIARTGRRSPPMDDRGDERAESAGQKERRQPPARDQTLTPHSPGAAVWTALRRQKLFVALMK